MVAQVGIGVTGMANGSTYLKIAVTEIEQGDQAILKKLSNATEYQGGTVYYVHGTLEVLAVLGTAGDSIATAAVVGVQNDGAGAAGTFGVKELSADCTGSFVLTKPTVGDRQKTCTIALAKPGTTLVGAAFIRDDSVPNGGTSDDEYFKKPVLWLTKG